MRLLLDTHIWLWTSLYPSKVKPRLRRQLENPSNELFLSPVSIWEAGHLVRGGRFRTQSPFAEWLASALAAIPIREARITFEVATAAAAIRLPQSDPGDVFLAATAVAQDLTLVTADEQLLGLDWLRTMPNR